MKIIRLLIGFCAVFILPIVVYGQEDNSWEFNTTANLYILSDNTYLNPVVSADKNHLHLEARYNYEDLNTGSVFAGYNFHAEDSLEVSFTPIIGAIFGNSNGVAPGFLFELNYQKISISSEGEYFFSSDEKESNFFYSFSEIVYSPADWAWFGIAGQRTRAYKTDLEVQRGLVVGFGIENLEISGYIMNLGWDDVFGLVSVGYHF
jgi:hypothetical protein